VSSTEFCQSLLDEGDIGVAFCGCGGHKGMIPAPGQPKVHYGPSAVNYHSGETVVIIRRRKRRPEVA